MSILVTTAQVSFREDRAGRVLLAIAGICMAAGFGGIALFVHTTTAMSIASVAGFAACSLMAWGTFTKWRDDPRFPAFCVSACAWFCGMLGGHMADLLMSGRSTGWPVHLLVFALILGVLLANSKSKAAACVSLTAMSLAFALAFTFFLTTSGGFCVAGFAFALLALVNPLMAVNLACYVIMIPLAALGLGTLGAWLDG